MSQDSKVQVVADAMGNTIRQNQNKPDYGYIRLVQKRTTISPTGFISASNLSTLLTGTIEDLEASGLQHTKDIAGKAFLIFLYLTVNSVAKCCASDALPPFPKKIILPPFLIDLIHSFTRTE